MSNILDDDNNNAPFLKVKHILIIFIISCIILSIGGLFRMQSWPFGSEFLIIGTFTQCVSYVLMIIKAFTLKESNSFLNK